MVRKVVLCGSLACLQRNVRICLVYCIHIHQQQKTTLSSFKIYFVVIIAWTLWYSCGTWSSKIYVPSLGFRKLSSHLFLQPFLPSLDKPVKSRSSKYDLNIFTISTLYSWIGPSNVTGKLFHIGEEKMHVLERWYLSACTMVGKIASISMVIMLKNSIVSLAGSICKMFYL